MITGAELLGAGVFIFFLILICILRAFRGPTTSDRMVALDTINTLVAAALVVVGAAFGEVIFVDVAIVYAMLSFVTTLYISRHMEGNA
ncbi:MAG: cation:proton antiporter [Candidatus Aenigmatarchaeota archaeon]|nr:MAG: cation:proton antiporter [Candidatus Aenigmarchaeota archaeon]